MIDWLRQFVAGVIAALLAVIVPQPQLRTKPPDPLKTQVRQDGEDYAARLRALDMTIEALTLRRKQP
jgi:hypothetical protein